jgi:hypothetical protein
MTTFLEKLTSAVLFVLVLTLISGCVSAEVRSNLKPMTLTPNPRLGIASNTLLADAIGIELVGLGFTIVERGRLQAILEELKLSLSGITREEDFRRVGEILNVDGLVFVASTVSPYFPSRVGSATVKIVEVQTGTLIGGVIYQNGRGGAPGSPADAGMKDSLPETARIIAEEIAKGLRTGSLMKEL